MSIIGGGGGGGGGVRACNRKFGFLYITTILHFNATF